MGRGDGPRFEASSENELVSLDDEGHVLFVRQFGLFAEPEAVVDGEGIDGHSQVLRMDLGELFTAGIVSGSDKLVRFKRIKFC